MTQTELQKYLTYNPETGVFTVNKDGRVVGGRTKVARYARIRIGDKSYQAHRLAFLYMTGEWPKNEVDHINQDCYDNRWSNLRDADRDQQFENHSQIQNSSTGIRGIDWVPSFNRFRVRNRGKYVGRFRTLDEAVTALEAS